MTSLALTWLVVDDGDGTATATATITSTPTTNADRRLS
jgi:hypothetical protein